MSAIGSQSQDKYSQFHKSSWDDFPEKLLATGFAASFGTDAQSSLRIWKFLEKFDDPFFANNLYQLNFYGCSDFLRERGCKLASILQYNKNDSRIREIRFSPSLAVFEKTKEKFERVQRIVDAEKSITSLKCECVLGSMKAAFCSYSKCCWGENSNALKDYFETLPPKSWPKDVDRLPKDAQDKLTSLFEKYHALPDTEKELGKVEEAICQVMSEIKMI